MARTTRLTVVLLVAMGLGLAACGGGSSTDGGTGELAVTPNRAPAISGTPGASVMAGTSYSFTPTASDADHDVLTFSISSKPSWANFSAATGKLIGTPTADQAGVYINIVVSVSDGKISTPLQAFSIEVKEPPPAGKATLSWDAPTQNTDASTLTDLAGYRVYHGTSPNALTDVVQVPGASTGSYVYDGLAAGTHYFAVSAYNASGVESALSGVGSKIIL